MERDLQVHTDDINFLNAELRHVVQFFRGLEREPCDVFFGWSWRAERDKPEPMMKSVKVQLLDLEAEVRRAEDAGLGQFGSDDVWISFEGPALKFQFCHHGGIHLFHSEQNGITEHFRARWQDAGLSPKEFEKLNDTDWLPV